SPKRLEKGRAEGYHSGGRMTSFPQMGADLAVLKPQPVFEIFERSVDEIARNSFPNGGQEILVFYFARWCCRVLLSTAFRVEHHNYFLKCGRAFRVHWSISSALSTNVDRAADWGAFLGRVFATTPRRAAGLLEDL